MKGQKIFILAVLLFFCTLFLFGCGSNMSTADSSSPELKSVVDQAAEGVSVVADEDLSSSKTAYAAVQNGVEQKIIKNANLTVRVEEASSASKEVEREVERLGGYVSNSNQSKNKGDKLRIYMTLRVPAKSFDEFIFYLESLGTVEDKTVYTEDVTQEYIDLKAKIENLTIQEKRLQEILKQATKIEDILKIEQELARVRGEIDSYTGQLRYLTNKIDFSTVELTLLEAGIVQEGFKIGNMAGTWDSSKAAFVRSVNQLFQLTSSLIIVIFALLPFLALLAVILVMILLVKNKIRWKNKEI